MLISSHLKLHIIPVALFGFCTKELYPNYPSSYLHVKDEELNQPYSAKKLQEPELMVVRSLGVRYNLIKVDLLVKC